MQIKNLKLRNFRNYSRLDVDFSETFNIIYGNNAQGKTNIIEAIFLCASGRSHRTSRDDEMVKYDSDGFEVNLQLRKRDFDDEIGVLFNTVKNGSEKRKKISINEIPLKRIGDLMGHLNAVIFSPEDLLIVKQGPSERRRFIDITLSQLRPAYFYDLQKYSRILFQRNTLLKRICIQKNLVDTLEVWNKHLVKTGSRIVKARMNFIDRLNVLAGARHEKLTNNEEKLELLYDPSFKITAECSEDEIEDVFYRALIRGKENELRKGTTVIGPHRDDMQIVLNGESTKIYGSQGQQRTAVLSMKLAEIDLMQEESGEFPVLLLDDVLSELDDRRKEFLLDSIGGLQTFITSTDRGFFNRGNDEAAFFYIKNGTMQRN